MYQLKSQRVPWVGDGVNGDCGDKVNKTIDNGVSTEKEIREAIAPLKNNKAPGEDEITNVEAQGTTDCTMADMAVIQYMALCKGY